MFEQIRTFYKQLADLFKHTSIKLYWLASTVSCYRGCMWFRTPQLVSSLEPGGSSTWRQCYAIFTGYQYGKGSSSRRPYWYTSVFMAWLHHTWHHTAHRSLLKLDVPTCDPRQQANSLCHVLGQFTVVVALLYTALSRQTVPNYRPCSLEQSACWTAIAWHDSRCF